MMQTKKQGARHNNEYRYKRPFVEHSLKMHRASRIRHRIVMALILTNALWILVVAFIMSVK